MTDSGERAESPRPIPKGGLYSGHRRARRKADLEMQLRQFAELESEPVFGGLADEKEFDREKLRDAIREVAIPAIEEARNAREARFKREAATLPLFQPPSQIESTVLATARLVNLGESGRPAADVSTTLSAAPTKESLRKAIMVAQNGETFKTAVVATVLDISTRTVSRWANNGRLKWGQKRGTVTAASTQRVLRSAGASESN